MSDLHTIKDTLINIIKQYSLHINPSATTLTPPDAQTDSSLQKVLEAHIQNSKKNNSHQSSFVFLPEPTIEQNYSDEPLLRVLLQTILLLDSFTSTNNFLTADQINEIEKNLLVLFTTIHTLNTKCQNSYLSCGEFNLRGFIRTDTADAKNYSDIGEQIYQALMPILNIANIADPDEELPKLISAFVQSYQHEVAPKCIAQLTTQVAQMNQKNTLLQATIQHQKSTIARLSTENARFQHTNGTAPEYPGSFWQAFTGQTPRQHPIVPRIL